MEMEFLNKEIEASGKKVHSLLIYKSKELLLESYFNGKTASDLQNLYSCTKSISSLLMGIALGRNSSVGLDTPIAKLLPEYDQGQKRLDQLTLRHFMNQTTGFKWMETGRQFAPGHSGFDMEQTEDWGEFLFNQPISTDPGKRFSYNTGVSHVLPLIAGRVAHCEPKDLLEESLLGPLGIEDYKWEEDPQGNPLGGKGLHLAPRALLEIGKMVMAGGEYNGKRIVSSDWLKESLSPQARGHIYYGTYGYQWWLKRWDTGPQVAEEGHNVFCGIGFGGQFLFLVPDWDLIVVFTGKLIGAENFEYPQALVREQILPYFQDI